MQTTAIKPARESKKLGISKVNETENICRVYLHMESIEKEAIGNLKLNRASRKAFKARITDNGGFNDPNHFLVSGRIKSFFQLIFSTSSIWNLPKKEINDVHVQNISEVI